MFVCLLMIKIKFRFEKARVMKLEVAKSIQKFNYKPDQGINHLFSIGYIQPDR